VLRTSPDDGGGRPGGKIRAVIAFPHRSAVATVVVTVAAGLLSGCGGTAGDSGSCVDTSGSTVKIGSLNSLSGPTAVSEVAVRDAIKLAVEQINASGGVIGKRIELIGADGASQPTVFAEKAEKLITHDCVAAVFGGWTSSSRKAMLPVFEGNNALLYYPVRYEGLESSRNVFYTGAAFNQQIVPALDYLKEKGVTSLYLVGSDSAFPQTADAIIKAYAAANSLAIRGEYYAPVGSTDFATIVDKVRAADADAVVNTLSGDSNGAFFREYKDAGLTPRDMPVVSVSVTEDKIGGIGVQNVDGQLTAWNYYQTVDNPVNQAFVKAYKDKYGQNEPTSDPMEAAYVSVYLWKNTVEKAKSFDVKAIQDNAGGVSFDAPEGLVTIDGTNHHITKTARIGEIRPDGLIYTVWQSPGPIPPDPYLKSYPWAAGLSG
jgi:urea transport system substrate-binding protein